MSDITRDYSFGGWLRQMRVDKELTLREAAKRMGMDPGNLSKLERSELEPPRSAKKIRAMCKALGYKSAHWALISTAYQHHVSKLQNEFGSFLSSEVLSDE